jgi:acetoin utilization deacetylase AcuC-like enzyme
MEHAGVGGEMILYNSNANINYGDFGIVLPIERERSEMIINSLCSASVVEADTDILSCADLYRVHEKGFVDRLFAPPSLLGGRAPVEKELLTAWELIDGCGKPYRYEPEKAERPLSDLFRIILAQAGGSYLAASMALSARAPLVYYLGGGMHHARYDSGAGFCLINDVVIAAMRLLAERRCALIWIVDVDAHKGCGSAELIRFARERGALGAGAEIGQLSIHMAAGWPLDADTLRTAEAGRAPLIPSDVEAPVAAGREADYIPLLEGGLKALDRLFRLPDLAIVLDGADVYEHDGLESSGLLRLSLALCVERSTLIYEYLKERGIPQAWLMAGGYGSRAWEPASAFLNSIF